MAPKHPADLGISEPADGLSSTPVTDKPPEPSAHSSRNSTTAAFVTSDLPSMTSLDMTLNMPTASVNIRGASRTSTSEDQQ